LPLFYASCTFSLFLPGECIPDIDPALSPACTLLDLLPGVVDLSHGLYLVMPADGLHQDRYIVVALFFNYPVVTDADLGLPEQIREGLVRPGDPVLIFRGGGILLVCIQYYIIVFS
jgi:hypothetical protein